MESMSFALVLWSFLIGLIIGIVIGQIEGVKKAWEYIKEVVNDG